jgi:hypothetical protein
VIQGLKPRNSPTQSKLSGSKEATDQNFWVLKAGETRGFDGCKFDCSRHSGPRARFQIAFNIKRLDTSNRGRPVGFASDASAKNLKIF